MSSKFAFRLVCTRCGDLVCVLDRGEYQAWLDGELKAGLCFACEPDVADSHPDFLGDLRDNDKVKIDNVVFYVYGQKLAMEGLFVPRAHEGERARGLSSYTNLNRILKGQAVFPSGEEFADCPTCRGTGELNGLAYVADCYRCGGVGIIQTGIVIPSWIISGGCENV